MLSTSASQTQKTDTLGAALKFFTNTK